MSEKGAYFVRKDREREANFERVGNPIARDPESALEVVGPDERTQLLDPVQVNEVAFNLADHRFRLHPEKSSR